MNPALSIDGVPPIAVSMLPARAKWNISWTQCPASYVADATRVLVDRPLRAKIGRDGGELQLHSCLKRVLEIGERGNAVGDELCDGLHRTSPFKDGLSLQASCGPPHALPMIE